MDTEQPAGPVLEERRPCPECGEQIVVGAVVCRYCGAALDPETGQVEAPGAGTEPSVSEPVGPAGGYALASLIMGISSLMVVCCCWPLSLPLSIMGVIFGVMGLKSPQRPLAMAGLVISVLALLGVGGLFVLMLLGQLPQMMQGSGF